MARPKCVVEGFICEGNCPQCDLMDANLGCMHNEFTSAEKIAALLDALKELGVDVMTTDQIYTGHKPKEETL